MTYFSFSPNDTEALLRGALSGNEDFEKIDFDVCDRLSVLLLMLRSSSISSSFLVVLVMPNDGWSGEADSEVVSKPGQLVSIA
jgi:hypothetical protein